MVATADDIPRELLKDGRSLLQYPVQDDSARVLCLRAEQNSGRLRAALGIPNLCSTPGGVVEGRTPVRCSRSQPSPRCSTPGGVATS